MIKRLYWRIKYSISALLRYIALRLLKIADRLSGSKTVIRI
jgi:hypothetical protein